MNQLDRCSMNKNEDNVNVTIRGYNIDLDVTVPISEKQSYLEAAEYIIQKIDACAKVYASSKPLMEIMLLVMLDIAHDSMKQQHKRGISEIYKRIFKTKEL